MKKLAFTIQVIVLLAMFPAYLVVELNHAQEKSATVNQASVIDVKTEIDFTQKSIQ